jgi:hypothetical protein
MYPKPTSAIAGLNAGESNKSLKFENKMILG